MASIHKILVPIDFSDPAAGAARYAEELAERFGASLTLLHVAPPIHFEFAFAQPTRGRYLELAAHRNQTLRQAINTYPADPPLRGDAERLIVEGEPYEEILRVAHDQQYDLILMPTRGGGPLQRWLLIGSVTVKVLHAAECPVLAGVGFADGCSPFDIKGILCAIDLGRQSQKVLCWGQGLARELGVPLTVVHAAAGAGEATQDFFDDSWRRTLTSRLHERIARLQSEAGVEAEIVVETGDPHKVVARVARRLSAGLVVIGRGVSGDIVGRLRAHAYEIIRMSPCPVISV
ncbi:MAG: universal stress protein [Bryobacteraceae bacterium]|nr:universal stress protein [Bryobacteraceae bacterium]